MTLARLTFQLCCIYSSVFAFSLTFFGMSFLMHESAPMVAAMQLLVPTSLRGTAAGLEIVMNSALSALVDYGIGAADDAHHNIRVQLAAGLLVTLSTSFVGYEITMKLWRRETERTTDSDQAALV